MTNNDKMIMYSILWLRSLSKTDQEIIEELELTPTKYKNYNKKILQMYPDQTAIVENNTKTNNVQNISVDNLMIRHTSSKKDNTVSIMTKEASEVADSKRNINHRNQNKNIFRPKNS
jgi:hypothetical protein